MHAITSSSPKAQKGRTPRIRSDMLDCGPCFAACADREDDSRGLFHCQPRAIGICADAATRLAFTKSLDSPPLDWASPSEIPRMPTYGQSTLSSDWDDWFSDE